MLGFVSAPVFANQYDDDEKIRRFAQQIADEDQRQRDAAKQRADDAERANNPHDSSGDWLCLLMSVGIPAFLIWQKYQK